MMEALKLFQHTDANIKHINYQQKVEQDMLKMLIFIKYKH